MSFLVYAIFDTSRAASNSLHSSQTNFARQEKTKMDEQNYLSRARAADYLGLSVRTLDRLRVAGGGPLFWKGGSRVLYDQRDMDTWVEGRKQRSTSDSGNY